MTIYFAASEVYPYIKTGGLADVAHSLPKELAAQGHEVFVVLPLYGTMAPHFRKELTFEKHFDLEAPGVNTYVGVFSQKKDGVTYYFIDNEFYFARDNLYGYWDDGERFSYFCRSLLAIMDVMDFCPDIIHLNDWHTGASAPIFKEYYASRDKYKDTKVIFTIHNLKYQGIFPPSILKNLDLNEGYLTYDALEYYGNVNFMKAGINFCDYITTVSKTYMEELKYSYYSEGLHSLLQHKKHMMMGIVNGIDFQEYNPAKDKDIYVTFTKKTVTKNKKKNKEALQKALGLDVDPDKPLLALITRLVPNKGIDLIRFIFDELMEKDCQFVVLGNGESEYEESFIEFAKKYPGRVSANIFFSEPLAKKIYAACDIFMMPSRFEPCGLGQLIAMRYGAVPVVRETGGLKDTVMAYNRFTGEGNGFRFKNYNAHELLFTLKDALHYYKDEGVWNKLVQQAMSRDSSWKRSAKEYAQLYKHVQGKPND